MNLMVEWVVLMLCIEKVPGSNLSPELGYPDNNSSSLWELIPVEYQVLHALLFTDNF